MTALKLLVTGCRGQLGSDLLKLPADEFNIIGVDLEDFDIRDKVSVDRCFASHNPDIVLHTAAYTDVDGCEKNRELAWDINVTGTSNLAVACREIEAKMVYYSTDYVFDGQKKSAYIESDQSAPKTVYGKSKLAGEESVMTTLDDYVILRIAWLYGLQGNNFVKTMIRLGKRFIDSVENGDKPETLKVVSDQILSVIRSEIQPGRKIS